MTTEQGSEMNQTEKQAMAAYKDVLRAIVSLVRPPRAIHEEKLLAAILLALMFGAAIAPPWW